MDLEKLKHFIKFMDENSLTELEVEEEGQRIRLRKREGQMIPAASEIITPKDSQKTESKSADENLKEIKSPMVGTFYRAASPEAKPFVDVGESCKKGDVVCIVEAMKVMNEIKAEESGQIAEIVAENGQPVEFGQTLFTIRKP